MSSWKVFFALTVAAGAGIFGQEFHRRTQMGSEMLGIGEDDSTIKNGSKAVMTRLFNPFAKATMKELEDREVIPAMKEQVSEALVLSADVGSDPTMSLVGTTTER